MLTLTIVAGMVITLVFLVLADEKSLMKSPILHKGKAMINPMIKAAYRSDMISHTIRQIKKFRYFVISTICGLTEKGGM